MATTASGVTAAHELDELYRLHAAEVFRYAYAVLGNRADAEDITQTTFVNALRALERGDRPRKPTNWLITIAHNLIRQRFRQQQARPLEVELDHDVAAAEDADDGPSIDDLVRALQRIPPTQRQALVLRELEGRSYAEIGELLGVSQSALEALIFRARRSLADELENLVTCDRAELALTRTADGRIGRKERRRLLAHIDECASCARVAARSIKYRRAFKALAILPLPLLAHPVQGRTERRRGRAADDRRRHRRRYVRRRRWRSRRDQDRGRSCRRRGRGWRRLRGCQGGAAAAAAGLPPSSR